MATLTIEKYLPKTTAYINKVFENADRERGGHHNYVIEQLCINTLVPLCEKTAEQLAEYDANLLAHLQNLDGL